jgi:hypothetical protein
MLEGNRPSMAAKWRRELLKLVKLSRDQAQAALFDLPDVFSGSDEIGDISTQIEIRLFEFSDIGQQRNCYPIILTR